MVLVTGVLVAVSNEVSEVVVSGLVVVPRSVVSVVRGVVRIVVNESVVVSVALTVVVSTVSTVD